MDFYSEFDKHFALVCKLLNEMINGNYSNPELMTIPLSAMSRTVKKMTEHYNVMEEDYAHVRSGTILQIGDELKSSPDFDIGRYARSLEKEVFRICKASKETTRQWQENYAYTRKLEEENIKLKRQIELLTAECTPDIIKVPEQL